MKFFNRKRYTDPTSRYDDPFLDMKPEVPVHEIVPESQTPQWDCAKVITSEEANPGKLPMGWYIWKKGYRYFALKPNETNTEFERGYDFYTPKEAQTWLGIPIPEEMIREAERPSFAEQLAAIEAQMKREREAQHAEAARLAQEQQKNAEEGNQARQTPAQMPEKYDPMELNADFEIQQNGVPAMPRVPSRRRTNEVHIRFSDEEYRQMQDRAAASCLPMSIFMRQAILTGEIKADLHRDLFMQHAHILNTTLQGLRGECGKLGGLLKKAIKPNEEQKAMNPDEWEDLIRIIHALFGVQRSIERTLLKLNGRIDHELQ